MQTSNYWKRFETTGKVEDYLSYRQVFENSERPCSKNIPVENQKDTKQEKGKPCRSQFM